MLVLVAEKRTDSFKRPRSCAGDANVARQRAGPAMGSCKSLMARRGDEAPELSWRGDVCDRGNLLLVAGVRGVDATHGSEAPIRVTSSSVAVCIACMGLRRLRDAAVDVGAVAYRQCVWYGEADMPLWLAGPAPLGSGRMTDEAEESSLSVSIPYMVWARPVWPGVLV